MILQIIILHIITILHLVLYSKNNYIFYLIIQLKINDNTNNVFFTYTLIGIINSDINYVGICNNYIAYYSSINPGTNIQIVINKLSLYGLKSNNYFYIINNITGTIINNNNF